MLIEDPPEHLDYLATLLRRYGCAVDPFTDASMSLHRVAGGEVAPVDIHSFLDTVARLTGTTPLLFPAPRTKQTGTS